MFDFDNAVRLLLQVASLLFLIMICLCLVRAIRGPKLVDRVIAINMICVKTILLIITIGINYYEYEAAFLVDIALVYALLSFLAIIILTKFMLQVRLNHLRQARAARSPRAEDRGPGEGGMKDGNS